MRKKISQVTELDFREKILRFYFFNKEKVYSSGLAFIAGIAVLIFYFSAGSSEKDAGLCAKIFDQWQKKPTDFQLKKDLDIAARKIPGFQKGIEAEVAQILLSCGNVELADPIAKRCIDRLKIDFPLHAIFSEATLWIEKKEFQKALEISVGLKEAIEREAGCLELATIYSYNLFRIACLQKQVGNVPGERLAWEEVRAFMDKQQLGRQFLDMAFRKKGFSLTDFISVREQAIHSSREW